MIIVLDIGNVIIKTSFEKVSEVLLMPNDTFEKDNIYFEFSKGKISPLVYYEYFKKKYDVSINYVMFCNAWNSFFVEETKGINLLINSLSKKFDLYVLSNSNIIHGLYTQRKFSHLFAEFKYIFYSFNLGFRKPDKEIFDLLLRITEKKGNEIVFIDDKEENVNAANKKGINGILFEDTMKLKTSLTEIINYND